MTQARCERRALTAHPWVSHFLPVSSAPLLRAPRLPLTLLAVDVARRRAPQTAPWVTVMTSTIEGAGTSLEESAATMIVLGREMKDVEGTIGMTESGTGVGSAAVGVNIVTMTGIVESASLLPATSSAPRRSA